MISSSLQAYHSNELRIQMYTSSGDAISLNFSNERSLSMQQSRSDNHNSNRFTFSSIQSFQFHVDSNGIDAQDKKEIDALMTLAQPFIDDFLNELADMKQTTPLKTVATALDPLFSPLQYKSLDHQNYAKNEIVNLFDTTLSQMESFDTLLHEAQQFLEEVLHLIDNRADNTIYA